MILLTGATGNVGAPLVGLLAEAGLDGVQTLFFLSGNPEHEQGAIDTAIRMEQASAFTKNADL